MSTLTASARTATLPSSSKHASSSTHPGRYDLKACLEILRKLAPKVTPDLPCLPSSITNNNVTQRAAADALDEKHKSSKRSSEESDGNDAARLVKRSKNASHHKRSGSTSSVISLSDLKARNNASKKNKATEEDEGNASSASASTSAFASRKSKHNPSNSRQTQPSSLSISTNNNHHQRQSSSTTSISPTLPSPALTVSSAKESSRFTPQVHQNGFANSNSNALSPEATTISNAPLSTTMSSTATGINNSNAWTRERFKKIAAICREKGRSLKHSGDKKMREYSSGLSPPSSSSLLASSSAHNHNNNNRHLIPIIALFEQIDAVILYAYAFWCEDQAAGQLRNRQQSSSSSTTTTTTTANVLPTASSNSSASTNSDHSSNLGASTSSSSTTMTTAPIVSNVTQGIGTSSSLSSSNSWKAGCITENWKSIFGLVAFVRGRAEKLGGSSTNNNNNNNSLNPSKVGYKIVDGLPRAMEIVVAWMNMLEALILQHLTTNASRNLNTQASKLLSNNTSSSGGTGLTPTGGNELSPPGGDNESIISSISSTNGTTASISNSTTETNDFLNKFLKLQSDLEKIHTLWPSSQNILLHPELSNLSSLSSSSFSGKGRGNGKKRKDDDDNEELEKEDLEDLLSLVLRKGRMAYDYEPTKLDDIVIPDLPSYDDHITNETGFKDDNNDHEGDDMDADGEPDTSVSIPNDSSTTNNTTKKRSSSSNTTITSIGPKSPEDLFKDEENYFRFSWPIIIHHPNSIAHTTSFGRALLFEMSSRLGIEYKSPSIA